MSNPKFVRKIEDFICDNCGLGVKGDGYTNHCNNCLWSKHVDINPGDRADDCCGMMEPISKEIKGELWIINHKCIRCGFERKAHIRKNDNFDELLKV